MATPKVAASFALDRTEFAGRRAGVGYSLVGIAMRRGTRACAPGRRAAAAKIACANPNQVVLPAALAWYSPEAAFTRSTSAAQISRAASTPVKSSNVARASWRLEV